VPITSSDPDLSVLRTSVHGSLIGSPLADFSTTGEAGGRRWVPDYPDSTVFTDVDLAGEVPAYVRGRLENGRPRTTWSSGR
jgi:hypothetical protein